MFVNVLAESAPAATGGFNFTTLILLAVFGLFIFLMFRRNKKAQQAVQEQQSKMAPGVDVMTSYGLFGTVVSVDEDENKVLLELSPGTHATVHRQSVTKIITDTAEDPVVPDDASTLTGDPAVEPGTDQASADRTEPVDERNKDDRDTDR